MNCKHCGKWVDGQPAFCYHCGEPTVKGKKAVMWTAILSAVLLGASGIIAGMADYTESVNNWHYVGQLAPMVEMLACAVLLVGFVRTAFTREMSVFTFLGFLFMISANGETAWECLNAVGLEGCARVIVNPESVKAMSYFEPLMKTVISFLMALWSLMSLRCFKSSTGSTLRLLWFVPAVAAIWLGMRWVYVSELELYLFQLAYGTVKSHLQGLNAIAQLLMLAGVCTAALCLFYVCKEPAPRIEAAPVMPAQPVQPVQPAQPVQPVQPVRPVQPVQPVQQPAQKPQPQPDAEIGKKLAAYKDLLDCGILTQAEYDRKVNELTGRNG